MARDKGYWLNQRAVPTDRPDDSRAPKHKERPICTECGSPTTHCYPGDCSRAATDPGMYDGWDMAYYGD